MDELSLYEHTFCLFNLQDEFKRTEEMVAVVVLDKKHFVADF